MQTNIKNSPDSLVQHSTDVSSIALNLPLSTGMHLMSDVNLTARAGERITIDKTVAYFIRICLVSADL